MKKYSNLILTSFFILSLAVSSCKKDEDEKKVEEPAISNPEEQITTVIISGYDHHNPTDSRYQFSVQWEDLDGDGGNPPSVDSLLLDTGIVYHAHIILLDKTKTPWDTISHEVEEEKNVHQFFYTLSDVLKDKVKIQIQDYDDNNPALPLGLAIHLDTRPGSAYALPVSGSLNVVLSHYDEIPKTALPSPESDLDIEIPVRLINK